MGRYFSLISISTLETVKVGLTTSPLLFQIRVKTLGQFPLGREYTWLFRSPCLLLPTRLLDSRADLYDVSRAP